MSWYRDGRVHRLDGQRAGSLRGVRQGRVAKRLPPSARLYRSWRRAPHVPMCVAAVQLTRESPPFTPTPLCSLNPARPTLNSSSGPGVLRVVSVVGACPACLRWGLLTYIAIFFEAELQLAGSSSPQAHPQL